MQDFTIKVIEQRRQALEDQQKQSRLMNAADEDVGSKRRMALLDVLLMATVDGRPLNNDEIREEVDTFMFEGHDTTTSALSFCLHEVSRHPEVQEKMLEEILRVLGTERCSISSPTFVSKGWRRRPMARPSMFTGTFVQQPWIL